MRPSYFRISVTSRCNFRCHFCHNEGQKSEGIKPLSASDIVWSVGVAAKLGFSKVKLTGGEPTLRSDLPEIITGIREIGIEDLSMITNGSTLPKTIEKLYKAGLPRLNISLYTLDSSKFENTQCVRRSLLDQTIAGVDAALKLGYVDTKINYVIESKKCVPDLLSILTFAGERNLTVVTLPMLKSGSQSKNVISLAELDELVRSLGVVAEKSLIDEAGIHRSLLTLKSGARVMLRRHELGDLGPFLACKSCHYSPECQEGIFPIRLSETGVLSPCLANPTLRRNVRKAIHSRDSGSLTRTLEELVTEL